MIPKLECEMYPPFIQWLERNADIWMQEPLIPTVACFDFIAVQGKHVVVYELKLSNAKRVIQQANRAVLWCDHSYAVLPHDKAHLGLKYKNMLYDHAGLMELWPCGDGYGVNVLVEPELKKSHITHPRLRQNMIEWMIRETINRHQHFIASWRNRSYLEGIRLPSKRTIKLISKWKKIMRKTRHKAKRINKKDEVQ